MAAEPKIHPSSSLGPHVSVAADTHIGPNCYVDGRTKIGARSRLLGGITLVGDASIGEDCVLEPGVCLTAASSRPGEASRPLVVGDRVRIGAGSVLACGVTVGSDAHIRAGTIVVRNVPPHAIVSGNPATITGYDTSSPVISAAEHLKPRDDVGGTVDVASSVAGVKLYRFPRIRDLRGDLSVGEFGREVPFEAKRYFLVFDVPSEETRGEHAHRECEQFLVCVSGKVAILVDDGKNREEFELNAPNLGLYIPPRVWGVQYKYSASAVLLVFASHYYDARDYIRDYDQFIAQSGQPP